MRSEKQRLHLERLSKRKRTEEEKHKIRLSKVGNKNPMWAGDNVGYYALHEWVKKYLKKPLNCEECKKETTKLDLANKGIYNRELENWEYLCRKCHMIKDGRLKKFKLFDKPKPQKMGKIVKCFVCQKEVYRTITRINNKSKKNFCTRKCLINYQKQYGNPKMSSV